MVSRAWTSPGGLLGARVAVLFAYGFRPFFLLAAVYAMVPMLLWSGFLLGLWGAPVGGDPIAWHMHEMVFGLGGAALAGFLLTAVPEFTDSKPVTGRRLAALVICWLEARVAVWNMASFGPWPAVLLSLLFLGWLIALVAEPLWTRGAGRHRAFLYGLAALWFAEAATCYAWLGGSLPGIGWSARAGVNTAVGVMMILILLALARISMVIVNRALEGQGDTERHYLARPPRPNLAIFAIALFLALDVLAGDWLGRGSRHLLSAGAMGLAVLAVMSIAGQIHTGRELADAWPIRLAFVAIVLAAAARALPVWLAPSAYGAIAYGLSGLLWSLGFGLYLFSIGPMLLAPRADGEPG